MFILKTSFINAQYCMRNCWYFVYFHKKIDCATGYKCAAAKQYLFFFKKKSKVKIYSNIKR